MLLKLKKRWPQIFGVLALVLIFNACSITESKIKSIVEREIGPDLITERARLEIEKQLGKQHSKLKGSLIELVRDKTEIDYTEIIVEGRRARVRVRATLPRLETLGALFSEGRHIPRDKMLEMSAQEFMKEINRTSRKPASENDLQTDTYEFYIDFERNKDWAANQDQLRRAYSKKNLIN